MADCFGLIANYHPPGSVFSAPRPQGSRAGARCRLRKDGDLWPSSHPQGANLRMQSIWRNRRVTVNGLPKAVTDRTHFTAHLVRNCSLSKMRQLNGGRWRPFFKSAGGLGRAASAPTGARGLVLAKIINKLPVLQNHYIRISTQQRGAGRSPANKK
jgi:hypothetical protein